jgi:3-oxoadipate enol-lactonase
MTKLDIGGESFNVLVEGPRDAPAVILAHALGADLTMWDLQASVLSQRFRVVRYDSRGHSSGPTAKGSLTLADLGRDALAILDALGIARAHWLGLSMGGSIGMWLLVHRRNRIERAVLANTATYLGPATAWDARINAVREGGVAAIAPAIIERWFTKEFREREPQVVARILEILWSNPAEGYAACAAAVRDMDLREEIKSVRAPVLVIAGSRDTSAPPQLGAEIAASIPGSRFVTLEAAHLSNIEAADGFNRAALDFLTDQ